MPGQQPSSVLVIQNFHVPPTQKDFRACVLLTGPDDGLYYPIPSSRLCDSKGPLATMLVDQQPFLPSLDGQLLARDLTTGETICVQFDPKLVARANELTMWALLERKLNPRQSIQACFWYTLGSISNRRGTQLARTGP